jgi:hypothetical protein
MILVHLMPTSAYADRFGTRTAVLPGVPRVDDGLSLGHDIPPAEVVAVVWDAARSRVSVHFAPFDR